MHECVYISFQVFVFRFPQHTMNSTGKKNWISTDFRFLAVLIFQIKSFFLPISCVVFVVKATIWMFANRFVEEKNAIWFEKSLILYANVDITRTIIEIFCSLLLISMIFAVMATPKLTIYLNNLYTKNQLIWIMYFWWIVIYWSKYLLQLDVGFFYAFIRFLLKYLFCYK